MKLYSFKLAPSPRLVRIYLAEKGIEVPTEEVNLRERAQLNDAFRAINDRCDVPFLVLDDGTGIGEAEAICRYFEALHPEPNLFGSSACEQAQVSMWAHRVWMEGFSAAAEALRNSAPRFENRAVLGPRNYPQIAALVERGKWRFGNFLEDLNTLLAGRSYVAGERFTFADIVALVTVDFGKVIEHEIGDAHPHVVRWHRSVAARPSSQV